MVDANIFIYAFMHQSPNAANCWSAAKPKKSSASRLRTSSAKCAIA
jgi:hypothetical protein